MVDEFAARSRELEATAEKVGGYVAPPWALKANPEGELKFSAIRQYSIRNKKPVSEFTDEDYQKIGNKR